jgi:hypothetical protein
MCIARDLRVAGAFSRFFSLRAPFPLELFSRFSISPPRLPPATHARERRAGDQVAGSGVTLRVK